MSLVASPVALVESPSSEEDIAENEEPADDSLSSEGILKYGDDDKDEETLDESLPESLPFDNNGKVRNYPYEIEETNGPTHWLTDLDL